MNVELIRCMGDDLAVIDAARVSFDKQSQWEQMKEKNLKNCFGIP